MALGWAFIAIVVTASVQTHPGPGLQGAGLGVTLALAVYAAAVATAVTAGWVDTENTNGLLTFGLAYLPDWLDRL